MRAVVAVRILNLLCIGPEGAMAGVVISARGHLGRWVWVLPSMFHVMWPGGGNSMGWSRWVSMRVMKGAGSSGDQKGLSVCSAVEAWGHWGGKRGFFGLLGNGLVIMFETFIWCLVP